MNNEEIEVQLTTIEIKILMALMQNDIHADLNTAFVLLTMGIKLMNRLNIPKSKIVEFLLIEVSKLDEGNKDA